MKNFAMISALEPKKGSISLKKNPMPMKVLESLAAEVLNLKLTKQRERLSQQRKQSIGLNSKKTVLKDEQLRNGFN